jgi:hypothetical protein
MASSRHVVIPLHFINGNRRGLDSIQGGDGPTGRSTSTLQPLDVEIIENKAKVVEDGWKGVSL